MDKQGRYVTKVGGWGCSGNQSRKVWIYTTGMREWRILHDLDSTDTVIILCYTLLSYSNISIEKQCIRQQESPTSAIGYLVHSMHGMIGSFF